jgi:hypothetical protein
MKTRKKVLVLPQASSATCRNLLTFALRGNVCPFPVNQLHLDEVICCFQEEIKNGNNFLSFNPAFLIQWQFSSIHRPQ